MPNTPTQDRNHQTQLWRDRQMFRIGWLVIALTVAPPPMLHAAADPVEQAVSTDPVISERGPHHRVWTRTNVIAGLDGLTRTNSSSYVELGSGIHKWDVQAGLWVDAEAVIAIEGNTAVGRKAAYQVTFAANANTAGAIELIAPDGKRFRSHVLGIAFYNSADGRSEMIGTIKDSQGELHSPNVVIFPDAFDGVRADLRYTYRIGSFEQDVILRENPHLPDGFAPDTTRLECWTEFIESPAATLTQRGRAGMTDDILDFGALQTGTGQAFALSDEAEPKKTALVAKRWLTIESRTFLVEAVRYNAIKSDLDKLPIVQAAIKAPNANTQLAAAAQPHFGDRPFPAAPGDHPKIITEKFRSAAAILTPRRDAQGVDGLPRNGLVLDYSLVGSLTNWTLQCDRTYCVSNTVHFYGVTIVEGGTVVKFPKTNSSTLSFESPVTWRTAQYRPAAFTAVDDNTIGFGLGSGTPSGYYGGTYLNFNAGLGDPHHIRISYAATGLKSSVYSPIIRDFQFLHCSNALYFNPGATATVTMENSLFYDVATIQAGDASVSGTHLTVHQCAKFSTSTNKNMNMLNSIFIRMTNWGNATSNLVSCLSSTNDSEFQTVGAGAHYLKPGSLQRNAGTTIGLSAQMLADLKTRTTYPPSVMSGWITSDMPLTPQVQRDTDTPDRGYHYDPLDFVWTSANLSNANLTISPGTAIGISSAGSGWGLAQYVGSTIVGTGSPTNLIRITRYSNVQEQANTNWVGLGDSLVSSAWPTASPNAARFSFSEWTVPAASGSHIIGGVQNAASLTFRDCQFFGGGFTTSRPVLTATNCLFHRVSLGGDDNGMYSMGLIFRNCTFAGGSLAIIKQSSDVWTFRDNLFDSIDTTLMSWSEVTNGFNGYVTSPVCSRLTPTNAVNDVVTNVSPVYAVGPLGNFYLPTNSIFVNRGSATADQLGFYHYTTAANQAKEGTSTNDLGFHYIALANGLPVDTDGEGLADYQEDSNGNGLVGAGETSYTDADTDYDGRTDFQETMFDSTDPLNRDSKEYGRLGYWRFNSTNWLSEGGQAPKLATNLQLVTSFDDYALQVTNANGILTFRDVETNGLPNINLRNGSIRFWYKPYWTSTNRGGTGPSGGDADLIRIGSWKNTGSNTNPTDGCLSFNTYYGGTAISLDIQDNQGRQTNNGQGIPAACNAFISNTWHEIVLSLSSTSALIFVNGVSIPGLFLNDGLELPIPPAAARAQGLVLGNRLEGGHPCQGAIEELETFNHAFQYIEANRNSRVLSVTATNNPPTITLDWRADPNVARTVQRRLPGVTNWTNLATNLIGWTYRDTNVVVGQKYEYNIDPSGVQLGSPTNSLWTLAGIDLPPIEYRGKIIVLVDKTLGASLSTNLTQLQEDLVGDGWLVITNFVPRHNDTNWAANPTNIAAIKSYITNTYYADPTNTEAVFIIGHVAIPYSGMKASDGHVSFPTNGIPSDNHEGAWTADAYYVDLDGIWTDVLSFPLFKLPLYPENTNAPADGKFDQDYIPTNANAFASIELAVGRIDFAKMPVFTTSPPSGVTPVSEVDLLKRYLDKDHRFRSGQITFRERAVALDEFTPGTLYPELFRELDIWGNSLRNPSRLCGFADGKLIETDLFAAKLSCFWALLSDGAVPDGIGYPRHFSRDLTYSSNEPPVAVYILTGSWLSDWNLTNDNILRACLATPTYGLISMSGLDVPWRFESLGLGETFGDGLLRTVNERTRFGPRYVTLLGDPSLRATPIPPPTNLAAATNLLGAVDLSWGASPATQAQYFIYRATTMTNQFSRLSSVPVSTTTFTDSTAPAGPKLYQVRALIQTRTASGSYTNLSQGVFRQLN